MVMDVVPYGGWSRCARLIAGDLEAIVTLEVGPRVIRFGRIGGPNEFVEYARHAGHTGGESYKSYGGHRLWTAPEAAERTYEPDNDPVDVLELEGGYEFATPLGPTGLRRTIRIFPEAAFPRFRVEHEVRNDGSASVTIAPWALSVMAPGGECLFPQAPYVEHAEALLPARPMVMWHYTEMQDPRWTWGNRVVRLRQDPERGSMKVGALIQQGYAAYANHGNVFFKRFPFEAGAEYPDFGCNFETFTRADMLEVESLGPLKTLAPGQSVLHSEAWYLLVGVTPPADDLACGEWLNEISSSRPLD
jgi:hypothetical protein